MNRKNVGGSLFAFYAALSTLILLSFVPAIPAKAQSEPLKVVTTTTIIADIAQNVGGDLVDVVSLIPPDSDVHAYQPTPTDVALVSQADVVLVNGVGLESFLSGLMENAASIEPVVVSNGIEILAFGEHKHEGETEEAYSEDEHIGVLGVDAECEAHGEEAHQEGEEEHEHGRCDPHVWTDSKNVMIWSTNIAEAFAAADPDNAETYRANATAYVDQLTALDTEVRGIFSVITDDRRILVTNHEFFGYFAHAYHFEVVGTVISGGSTLAEPDPQELADLVTLVEAEGVPAIFAEISANDRLAEVIASETGINVVTAIYSDSLSAADGPASTYVDYVRYNAQIIAEALS
jgi:zinc/manganese transport system substrate-binding protein